MWLIGTASIAFLLALTVVTSQPRPAPLSQDEPHVISRHGDQSGGSMGAGTHLGRAIFRYDTFGDEQLWTGVLRMHEVLAEVAPATALAVGLKVDVEALTREIVAALQAGVVDLTDPAVTLELLRLNAVVGVRGKIDSAGRLASVGITCALCHSTVDNSLTAGIGARLDGWANVDLNVGAIVALSPALDDATKAEFNAWGRGKYDPRHHAFDGTNLLALNSPSVPIVIPPIYGLKGVGFETFTGDGPISYWNSYVGVGQMGGQGTFNDPRIGLFINQRPDLVTPNLPALLDYQLSLETPAPPKGTFNRAAATRENIYFGTKPSAPLATSLPTSPTCGAVPGTRGPFCIPPRRSGWIRPTPHEVPPGDIGRHPCADCGNTRRIFMTAARRTCSRSLSITSGCSRCICRIGRSATWSSS